MSKLFDSLSKVIVDGYNNLSEKAEEVTRIGRTKLEIIAIKRDIEKIFVELGGRFYENFNSSPRKNMYKDSEVEKLILEIKNSEDKLNKLKGKLDFLKKEEGIDLD